MSEADLIEILREGRASIATLIGQFITISLAMVIGIYYFLNKAGMAIKVASMIIYSLGCLTYYGLMLSDSLMLVAALNALQTLPADGLSLVAQHHLAFSGTDTSNFFNIVSNGTIWAILLTIMYLLFFWKKPE